MVIMNGTREPLTLHAWNRQNNEATALQDVLARVHLERGHFRDITEATLQEEIAAEGAMELSEDDDDDDNEDEESPVAKTGLVNTREDLFKAKTSMLSFVNQAEQDILRSLDYVSLLESKHNSNGAITMSPILKSNVPVGTLGTDIWHRKPEDKTRKAQEALLATSVRLNSLQKSTDALLSAATRLEDNARKEIKYWDEILAITDKGWSVSRIRQHSHLLGVHFGFSGSSPEFARRSLAALVSDSEGHIALERGIGTKPMSLRAVVRKNGRVTGRSIPFAGDHMRTTLDARIRHARDSLYDEELHHELLRESRDLASAGISLQGSAITFNSSNSCTDDLQTVSLELVSFDQELPSELDATEESDAFAQAILYAARLLLSQAHRDRLNRQAQPPRPLSEVEVEQPAFPILRPLVWILRHLSTEEYISQHLRTIGAIFCAAGIDSSLHGPRTDVSGLGDVNDVESLVTLFLKPLHSTASLAISHSSLAAPLELHIHLDTMLDLSSQNRVRLSMSQNVRGTDPTPPFESSHLPDVLTACDSLTSEILAKLLHQLLAPGRSGEGGGGWDFDPIGIYVTRASPKSNQVNEASIELDTRASRLVLEAGAKSCSWTDVVVKGNPSFSEAAHDLLVD